jgi:tyrosyl-tRNA synthetase
MEAVPFSEIARERLEQGIEAYLLLVEAGLCQTRGEARRLIGQGGVNLNEERIGAFDRRISTKDLKENGILIRIGKKRYHKIFTP